MPDDKILIRKANGDTEPFEIEKLQQSLERARASKPAIEKITSHIIQEVQEGMTTQEIYHHAFSLLQKIEQRSAMRYSLRRALMSLGPSGFPFERLVAEIFKAQGYTVLLDQMVKGYCAEHEVDVVAWKGDELVICEVKYHGQVEMKSDLKVVLYVKARFDDLGKVTFTYDNKTMKLAEGQLITNTKFTISSIKYAECQGMKIIGWNYPYKGNLHDLIDEAKLHPITSLHSLNEHSKRQLLDQNIVLCKTLAEDKSILPAIGLSESEIESVRQEIMLLE
jgi:Holliday junction resolvase